MYIGDGTYVRKGTLIRLGVFAALILIICVLLLIFGSNNYHWNDGVCPNCGIRYELKAVDNGFKFYTCPECGQEVIRYYLLGGNKNERIYL